MKKLPLIIATVILSLGSFSFVAADTTISSYTGSVVTRSNNLTSGDYIALGTGMTGVPTYFQVYASSSTQVPVQINPLLIACSSSSTLSGCYVFATNDGFPTIATAAGIVTTFLTATTTMRSDFYYYMNMGAVQSGTSFAYYGDSTTGIPGKFCTNIETPITCSFEDSLLKRTWFVLGGDVVVQQPSYFEDIQQPYQLEVTATGVVPVSVFYYNIDGYDTVGLQVVDQSNNHLVVNTAEQSAIQDVLSLYATNLSLTANHAYRLRPYMRLSSSSSTPYLYGQYRDFSTVSDQFFNGSLANIITVNENSASSTLELFVNNVFNLQYVMAQKYPFNYFFEIARTLNTLSIGTSTAAYTFVMPFSGAYVHTATSSLLAILPASWDVITSDTIATYYPDSLRIFFRTLLYVTMTVAWGLAMFTRLRGVFA